MQLYEFAELIQGVCFDGKCGVVYYMTGNKDWFSVRKLLMQEVIINHQVKKHRGI